MGRCTVRAVLDGGEVGPVLGAGAGVSNVIVGEISFVVSR